MMSSYKKLSAALWVYLWLLFLPAASPAQILLAPGSPGKDAQWASAGKQGVGTSATLESKVWFTLQGGAMTEVYYPDVTTANVHLLQFVVVDTKTKKVETEKDASVKGFVVNGDQSKLPGPLKRFMQESWTEFDFSKTGQSVNALYFNQFTFPENLKWRIVKSYITDSESNTVMIRVRFHSADDNHRLYIYYDPSLANSGMHDTAWNEGEALLSQDNDISSALVASVPLSEISSGFYGTSDGLEQLKASGKIVIPYARAENGNVVQVARVNFQPRKEIDFALSFGKTSAEALQTAKTSLTRGFDKTLAQYTGKWADYVKTLPAVDPKYQTQFNMAAMQLKAHEDKTHRGANIASLSVPWGGGENADENNVGGYHLVWSRDLYQVATAYMALGDKDAATRALDFVFNVQQKPDGSFPQNSFLDGRPFWGSLQLDEVAYPLILAYRLNRDDKETYLNHVKKAADFLVKNGPKTPQERWEEKSGYSPSTIAAEIAGLVCAAEIARKNSDEASAVIYLAAADDWARNVERWTATTRGKYGDGNYYLRLTENGTPDAGEKTVLNNNGGTFLESEIVDAGFLELVRLGIKSPDDPLIVKSLKIIDEQIRVNTPNGEAFYRYNHDGYGEMDDGRRWNWDGKYTGKGRLWALLSGERGQFEIAVCGTRNSDSKIRNQNTDCLANVRRRLDAMLGFANEGLMIPEQIWDNAAVPKNIDKQFVPELKFGEGTGSATPLAWSMAQFIRLAVNLRAGRNLDTPDVVFNRYKNGIPAQVSNFGGTDQEAVLPLKAGEVFQLTRSAVPNSSIAYFFAGETRQAKVNEKGEFTIEIKVTEKEEIGILAVHAPDGATAFERIKVRSVFASEPVRLSSEIIDKIKTAAASPIIENGRAILFYRGAAKSVEVAGDMTGWSPGRIFMQDIGEDLKAVSLDLPLQTRAEYKIIVDGKWLNDPLNPNKLDNGVGSENNFFAMPGYQPTTYDKGEPPKLEAFDLKTGKFGTRQIKIYLPPGYDQSKATLYPVLYLQDGTEYAQKARAAVVQENLVKAGRIKPFIIVFVDPKERMKEYWANDDWADFMANELVPEIDKRYRTVQSREGRALLGASLGGVASVWVGLKYPDKFARIGGQSSSFWIDNERVVKALSELNSQKVSYRFYFDDGVLEGVEDSRRINIMLRGKGFPVTYREESTGHNWTSWRDRLSDAFIALWKS